MSSIVLTKKQRKFLNYIVGKLRQDHDWPATAELMDEFDLRSPNSVTQIYQALLDKKYIVKVGWGQYSLHPSQKYLLRSDPGEGEYGIPIKGIITAGSLSEAVESDLGRITLETIFPNLDRLFALRVSGDSMTGDNIEDGDIVLLEQSEVKDGDIAAVRYRDETSLKRIYRYSYGLKLEPSNSSHTALKISPDEFEQVDVIGKYVGRVSARGIHKA